jgi:L-rhamnose-H+ transport protein
MHEWIGFSFVVLAGIVTGSYFLGLKYVEPWKWENIWLVYATLALLVMPLGLASATAPHLGSAVGAAPSRDVSRVLLYGAGWGIGSVLSGLGVVRMGMALGVSVLIGVDAAVGSFVPMAVNTPDMILKRKGLMVIIAVVTLVLGVAVVGFAGKKRERSQALSEKPIQQGGLAAGLIICVLSGVFSAMMNFAFAFGGPISQAAMSFGASESGALNVVWLITLVGGFIPTGIYTGYLLTRRRTWKNFLLPRTGLFWLIGFGMALLWYSGVLFYGWGAKGMGRTGAVIGWPLFMAILILASSVCGFATGEWKGASTQAKRWMGAGLGILMVASVILGFANQL